jgi:4-hydroxybenzoate polyprenyltransferase
MAANGHPALETLGLIVLAMFFARSSAMAFNRIADSDVDKKNERTKGRAMPAGLITRRSYNAFMIISALCFFVTCFFINKLALYLSPIALFIVCFYSYCKRFTPYAHLVLGIALSIAPIGAWVAVNEEITLTSLLLGGAVMFWLAGFDILYSLQDMDFDKNEGLHSVPQTYGIEKSLFISRACHVLMVILLLGVSFTYPVGNFYYAAVALCAAFLVYEQSLVKKDDLSKINLAFFNVNGFISIAFMVLVILDTAL